MLHQSNGSEAYSTIRVSKVYVFGKQIKFTLIKFFFSSEIQRIILFLEAELRSCYPGWSAVAQSRLITTSASWVQAILLPPPSEQLGLQARTTVPS